MNKKIEDKDADKSNSTSKIIKKGPRKYLHDFKDWFEN